MTIECNADLGHACDADDGAPCPRCAADAAYFRALWDAAPPAARRVEVMTAEELEAGLRDAGRIGR